MDQHEIDLYALDAELGIEALPEANALSTVACSSSVSTASCPGTTAATVGSASCIWG